MRIGVDLDNTIVSYDRLIHSEADRKGLLVSGIEATKRAIRDFLRAQPGGEIEWQRIQADVYGPKMGEADLICGVKPFFKACASRRIPTVIISHKTIKADYDTTNTNLRDAAIQWLGDNLFGEETGIGEEQVFFGSTRKEKTDLIREQACSHFIDDLAEVFLEKSFPDDVERILFAPERSTTTIPGVCTVHSWGQIRRHIIR